MVSLIDITDLMDSVGPLSDKGCEESSSRVAVGPKDPVAMWLASFEATVRTDPLDKVDMLCVNISVIWAVGRRA